MLRMTKKKTKTGEINEIGRRAFFLPISLRRRNAVSFGAVFRFCFALCSAVFSPRPGKKKVAPERGKQTFPPRRGKCNPDKARSCSDFRDEVFYLFIPHFQDPPPPPPQTLNALRGAGDPRIFRWFVFLFLGFARFFPARVLRDSASPEIFI